MAESLPLAQWFEVSLITTHRTNDGETTVVALRGLLQPIQSSRWTLPIAGPLCYAPIVEGVRIYYLGGFSISLVQPQIPSPLDCTTSPTRTPYRIRACIRSISSQLLRLSVSRLDTGMYASDSSLPWAIQLGRAYRGRHNVQQHSSHSRAGRAAY